MYTLGWSIFYGNVFFFGKAFFPTEEPIELTHYPFREEPEWIPGGSGEVEVRNLGNLEGFHPPKCI